MFHYLTSNNIRVIIYRSWEAYIANCYKNSDERMSQRISGMSANNKVVKN